MAMVNTASRLTDEYVSYNEAASLLGVTRGTVDRAVNTCILTAVRLPGIPRNKFIPRFEIEALKGLNVNSRRAKEHLDQVRRERSMEKEYNRDGTDEYSTESELRQALDEVSKAMEIMKRQQEQMMKDRQEFLARVKETATHMLKLSFRDMMEEIINERMAQESIK